MNYIKKKVFPSVILLRGISIMLLSFRALWSYVYGPAGAFTSGAAFTILFLERLTMGICFVIFAMVVWAYYKQDTSLPGKVKLLKPAAYAYCAVYGLMKVYVMNAIFSEPYLRIIIIMLPTVTEIIGLIGAILIAED